MKKFTRPVTLTILGSLAFLTSSTVIQATHSWSSYHWQRTAHPFTLILGDNVSGSWEDRLAEASADWNRPEDFGWHGTSELQTKVLETVIAAGSTSPKRCKPTAGRVEVCSSKYGLNGWLGLAQISISGDHIVQGVAKVNDSYFNLNAYNTYQWRQLVMCQEIAHTFGLDHQDEVFDNGNLGSCMDYTDNPNGNTAPNVHDFEQLAMIYDHLDSSSGGGGGGGGPPGGGMGMGMGNGQPETPPGLDLDQFDVSQPGQWGQMIASSRNGRTAVFEIDFGNGQRIMTFVIWA